MKLTKTQLREIIREEVVNTKINEISLDKLLSSLGTIETWIINVLVAITSVIAAAALSSVAFGIVSIVFFMISGLSLFTDIGDEVNAPSIARAWKDLKEYVQLIRYDTPSNLQKADKIASKYRALIQKTPELRRYAGQLTKHENRLKRALEGGKKADIKNAITELVAYSKSLGNK
jgi:hypothetical protein